MAYTRSSGRRGGRLIVYGAIIFAVGLLITIVSYSIASSGSGGGFYIVSWGPMVGGVICMIRGIFQAATGRGDRTIGPVGGQGIPGAGYPGQPGYGQPGYGAQPGYGQPGAGGQPGYGGQPGAGGQPGYGAQPGVGAQPQAAPAAPAYNQPGYAMPRAGVAQAPGAAGPGVPAPGAGGYPGAGQPGGQSLPANWYPDPKDSSQVRWWDGQAWTPHTQPRS